MNYDQSVFPSHWSQEYPQFKKLIDYYYQWLDNKLPRTLEQNRNIDDAQGQFVDDLVNEVTNLFPVANANKRFVARHAVDVFRARGTPQGIEQLFRLFLDVDATVNNPGDYVFQPSADQFTQVYQIEISNTHDLNQAVRTRVTTSSGGSFVISEIKTINSNSKRYSVINAQDIEQPINVGDTIIVNNKPTNTIITGSLNTVVLTIPRAFAYSGQVVDIIGSAGGVAKGIVGQVNTSPQAITLNLTNGGSRYTSKPVITSPDPNVKVNVVQLGASINTLVVNPDPQFVSNTTQRTTFGGQTYYQATVGTIDQVNVGYAGNTDNLSTGPVITVRQPMSNNQTSQVTATLNNSQNFIGGETVDCVSSLQSITTSSLTGFAVNDIVVSPNPSSPTFIGIVRHVIGTNILLGDTQGTINTNDVVYNVRTQQSLVASAVGTNLGNVGVGRIISVDGQKITIRIGGGKFVSGGTIVGRVSFKSSVINSLVVDQTTAGANFNIETVLLQDQQVADTIVITECGVGFNFNQKVTFVDSDTQVVIGQGYCNIGSIGLAEKGTNLIASGISNQAKLSDNDYRQHYAYEIVSPLSFDRYSNIIRKYVHLSGTKMFGSVEIADDQTITLDHECSIGVSS